MMTPEEFQAVSAQAAQKTLGEIAKAEADEAVASFGDQGEYLRWPAVQRVQKLVQEGKLDQNNAHAVGKAFKAALTEAAKEAQQKFAGEFYDQYNQYSKPPSEHAGYFAERNAQIRRQKGLA